MRRIEMPAVVMLLSAIAFGQSPAPTATTCAKTITFAVAEGGQPVPAIPKFATKWISKTKHVEGYPELCLSQIPASDTANYVVIFSTSESSFDGLSPSAHTYTSSGTASGAGASTSSYGGTWNYAYAGRLPQATTTTLDLLRVDASKKVLVLRAYDQQGRQVSHYSVNSDNNREKLLEMVFADIHRSTVDPASHKRLTAPLSVYYVNCDVDSPVPASLMAANDPPVPQPDPKPTTPASPPPPPQPTLDLSSNPAGADIYLDGAYVGRTPFTATVTSGAHIVMMRKPEFGTWIRRIEVDAGQRKVAAYLERKFLTLPSSESYADTSTPR
ncbi:MAG TPA: PEGA domain-containing protein [Candidatus Eisenbacteria bacterium]|nr:PEGA domain-containing protein [Candidatus Eisenbacteria bacterium]